MLASISFSPFAKSPNSSLRFTSNLWVRSPSETLSKPLVIIFTDLLMPAEILLPMTNAIMHAKIIIIMHRLRIKLTSFTILLCGIRLHIIIPVLPMGAYKYR